MDTDQVRRLIALHDNADRALANLRNAGAMSTDDPRATELLEDAGDAYAKASAALFGEIELVMTEVECSLPESPADTISASETPAEGSTLREAAESAQSGGDAAS